MQLNIYETSYDWFNKLILTLLLLALLALLY